MNAGSKALLAALVAVPLVSQAQESNPSAPFSYNYAEIAYEESDFDFGGGDISGDGLVLSGSFEITEDWHAFAAYGNSDLDFGIDLDTWAIGAGYRYPLRSDTDVYGRILYLNTEVDVPAAGDIDEDGLGVQVRLRFRVSDVFEVEGGIQHLDVVESDTSLQASARYHFTQNLSAGIGITFAGDTDGIGVNARYSF
jgi:opacity protein-like surface antigen